jgi:hypothetical protein
MYKIICFAIVLVVSSFAFSANAASMAYSVNSDSGNLDTEDSLYLIDLVNGSGQRIGTLTSGIVGDIRRDTEGLAFSPDGTLWGIDDNSRTLFPISTSSGTISLADEIQLPAFPAGGGNDFGMTFSCDGSLFVTSVATRTLYQLDLEGNIQTVGAEGALGANISAIAAIGTPVQLYGLGNGQTQTGQTDSPNLYSIDANTGVATMIGPLGGQVGEYNQGGLAFDSIGDLWAITDRRIINNSIENLPSQIMNINMKTGIATVISNTGKIDGIGEVGFESLAIGSPSSCGDIVARSGPMTEGIPTLSATSRLLAIFSLMLIGFTILRRRTS